MNGRGKAQPHRTEKEENPDASIPRQSPLCRLRPFIVRLGCKRFCLFLSSHLLSAPSYLPLYLYSTSLSTSAVFTLATLCIPINILDKPPIKPPRHSRSTVISLVLKASQTPTILASSTTPGTRNCSIVEQWVAQLLLTPPSLPPPQLCRSRLRILFAF